MPAEMPAKMPARICARTLYIRKNLNPNQQRRRPINEAERKALRQQHYDHPDWDQKQLQVDQYESFR